MAPSRCDTLSIKHGLEQAAQLLDDPTCQEVLTDFRDGEGRTLPENLSALGMDVQVYLGVILFRDGTSLPQCDGGTVAFTAPGNRVGFVCGSRLEASWHSNRKHVVASLIHEMLHTLGLGENPPSSGAITGRLMNRCRKGRRLVS